MRSRWPLLSIGLVLGIAAVMAFDKVMYATSTEDFCAQSCHEMQTPYQSLQGTAHYRNAHGVSVSCADCHIPREFGPKMLRKIEASREAWGHIRGIIDTPEKYAAHRPAMRKREMKRMRANDSRECRNCHELERMDFDAQERAVRRYHRAMDTRGKTCVDCHADVAHPTAG